MSDSGDKGQEVEELQDNGVEDADATLVPEDNCPSSSKTGESAVQSEDTAQVKVKVLTEYKDLVMKHKNNTELLKDQLLPQYVVLCLGDEVEVASLATEVLYIFSWTTANLKYMLMIPHCRDALQTVVDRSIFPIEVRHRAAHIISRLDAKDDFEKDASKVLRATARHNQMSREMRIFISGGILHELTKRHKITNSLLKIAGVISVSYNTNLHHVIIRSKRSVSRDVLAGTVASQIPKDLDLFLVRDDRIGGQRLIPIDPKNLHFVEQENVIPDYLPEEEGSPSGPGVSDNGKAVALPSDVKTETKSLWKSARKFLADNLYW